MSLLRWMAATLAGWACMGVFAGAHMRPAVQRYVSTLTTPVTRVTQELGGR